MCLGGKVSVSITWVCVQECCVLITYCAHTHRLLAVAFEGLLPRDNPKNTRFAINFFTSIGLGGLTWVKTTVCLYCVSTTSVLASVDVLQVFQNASATEKQLYIDIYMLFAIVTCEWHYQSTHTCTPPLVMNCESTSKLPRRWLWSRNKTWAPQTPTAVRMNTNKYRNATRNHN